MKYQKGKQVIEASEKAYNLIYKELGYKPSKGVEPKEEPKEE